MSGTAALLLLADGRLPAGGHAHSGGVETAAARGLVHDMASLEAFLLGRLRTSGAVAAWLAASACRGAGQAGQLLRLQAEANARTPSPALRSASQAQGRALLRLARVTWPSLVYDSLGPAPHHPLVLGVVCSAAALGPAAAAAIAASSAVTGAASAAVRLLGLDPIGVTALQARLAAEIDAVAALALDTGADAPASCPSGPLLDLLAEEHAAAAVPLFAS